MLINNLNLDFNLLICVFIILSILFLKKIKIVNNHLKIVFLLFVIISCRYDKRISILFFIMYIFITSDKNENIFESFSMKDKNGFHDLNNVLSFLKQKKSKKVLETMFSQEKTEK